MREVSLRIDIRSKSSELTGEMYLIELFHVSL